MTLQGPAASGDATQEKFFRTTYLLQRKINLLLSFEEQKTAQRAYPAISGICQRILSVKIKDTQQSIKKQVESQISVDETKRNMLLEYKC